MSLKLSHTHIHTHTNSRWVKSLRMCKWHRSRAPPQMPDQATLQPGVDSSSENRVAAAGSWLQLKSQLYSWPPASSKRLGGARDQGNSWVPTSKRKCNRRHPRCHLRWGQTATKSPLHPRGQRGLLTHSLACQGCSAQDRAGPSTA